MNSNEDACEEDGEGRSTPQGLPDGDAVVVERSPPGVDVVDEDKEEAAVAEGSHRESQGGEDAESELIEVGRGLANYNSAQIEKVMGLNRCVLSRPAQTPLPLPIHMFWLGCENVVTDLDYGLCGSSAPSCRNY